MRASVLAIAASLFVSSAAAPAAAQPVADAVGNVGVRSVDVPTADLAPVEAALDRAIIVNAAAARGRTATVSLLRGEPEVAGRRAEARRAADAGTNAMRSLDVAKAQAEFDRALTLFTASHGAWIDPGELSRLHTTRAKVALIGQDATRMREEFARAMPLHPTKSLDPAAFPPDAVKTFDEVQAAASRSPVAAPPPLVLADIARRTGLRWIVAAEARRTLSRKAGVPGQTGLVVALTVADATGGARSAIVDLPVEQLPSGLEKAVAGLFRELGVPPGSAESNLARLEEPDPVPAPTSLTPDGSTGANGSSLSANDPRPVPTQALPGPRPAPRPTAATGAQPWHRRWYVWAGAAAVLGAGAAVAASSSGGGGGGGGGGVTLVVERP